MSTIFYESVMLSKTVMVPWTAYPTPGDRASLWPLPCHVPLAPASYIMDSSCCHPLSQSFPCLTRAVEGHVWSILLLEKETNSLMVSTDFLKPCLFKLILQGPDTYSCSSGLWMQISLVHTSCSWIIMFLLASLHHEYFWAWFGLNQLAREGCAQNSVP